MNKRHYSTDRQRKLAQRASRKAQNRQAQKVQAGSHDDQSLRVRQEDVLGALLQEWVEQELAVMCAGKDYHVSVEDVADLAVPTLKHLWHDQLVKAIQADSEDALDDVLQEAQSWLQQPIVLIRSYIMRATRLALEHVDRQEHELMQAIDAMPEDLQKLTNRYFHIARAIKSGMNPGKLSQYARKRKQDDATGSLQRLYKGKSVFDVAMMQKMHAYFEQERLNEIQIQGKKVFQEKLSSVDTGMSYADGLLAMADKAGCHEWVCPITFEVFREPVYASDGIVYENINSNFANEII